MLGWRQLQETKLRTRMPDAGVARFVMHYERLTNHLLRTLPAAADVVVTVDAGHGIAAVRWRD